MNHLSESHKKFLEFLNSGGIVGIAIYGKKSLAMEILSRPLCTYVGLKGVDQLREAGLVRNGDPSPYKSGVITPIVLTDDARVLLKETKREKEERKLLILGDE